MPPVKAPSCRHHRASREKALSACWRPRLRGSLCSTLALSRGACACRCRTNETMFALHAPPACGVPARRKQAKSRQQAPFPVRAPAVASARSSGVVAAAVTKAPSVDIAAWNTAQRDARLDALEVWGTDACFWQHLRQRTDASDTLTPLTILPSPRTGTGDGCA